MFESTRLKEMETLTPVREEEGVGVVAQTQEGLFCIMDNLGNIVTKRCYDKIFYYFSEICIVSLNNKYGVIDKDGVELFDTTHTGFALTDSKDLLLVKGNSWSIINSETKEIRLKDKSKQEAFSLLNLTEDVLEELSVNWLE